MNVVLKYVLDKIRKAKEERLKVLAVVTVFFITIFVTHNLWLESAARFLIVQDNLSPADVIVVLGGGGPERVWQGVKLFNLHYGKWIIVTGMEQKFPGLTTTWPQLAKAEAMSLGVSEGAIILEERSTSTYEDAIYVKEDMLSREFQSAIVVSSPHHTRRARMIFRKVFKDHKDMSLQFSPVENGDFQVHKWWTREKELVGFINEYSKLILYFFKYII